MAATRKGSSPEKVVAGFLPLLQSAPFEPFSVLVADRAEAQVPQDFARGP